MADRYKGTLGAALQNTQPAPDWGGSGGTRRSTASPRAGRSFRPAWQDAAKATAQRGGIKLLGRTFSRLLGVAGPVFIPTPTQGDASPLATLNFGAWQAPGEGFSARTFRHGDLTIALPSDLPDKFGRSFERGRYSFAPAPKVGYLPRIDISSGRSPAFDAQAYVSELGNRLEAGLPGDMPVRAAPSSELTALTVYVSEFNRLMRPILDAQTRRIREFGEQLISPTSYTTLLPQLTQLPGVQMYGGSVSPSVLDTDAWIAGQFEDMRNDQLRDAQNDLERKHIENELKRLRKQYEADLEAQLELSLQIRRADALYSVGYDLGPVRANNRAKNKPRNDKKARNRTLYRWGLALINRTFGEASEVIDVVFIWLDSCEITSRQRVYELANSAIKDRYKFRWDEERGRLVATPKTLAAAHKEFAAGNVDFNYESFFVGLVVNHIQDELIGRFSQAANQVYLDTAGKNRPLGLGAGLAL